MDTQVDSRTLTSLDDLILQLLLHLGYHLLNTGGVDTAVGNKLVKCQTANLTTDRIKGRDDNSFRCIINYNLHSAGGFKRTDITAFTTDNTAFHLIVVNMENANGILDGCFGGHSLNGLNHDFLGLLIGIQLCLIHDFVDIAGSIGTSLILQALHQSALGFLGTET